MLGKGCEEIWRVSGVKEDRMKRNVKLTGAFKHLISYMIIICLFLQCSLTSSATVILASGNVPAEYVLVPEGGSRSAYTSGSNIHLGQGTIRKKKVINNDIMKIISNLGTIPDASAYVSAGERIDWYSIRTVNGSWCVYGQIASNSSNSSSSSSSTSSAVTGNAQAIVNAMRIGWNLGLNFDCYDGKGLNTSKSPNYYETLWGTPSSTQQTIDAVKAAGFGAVRIPITYRDHMDANGNIDQKWLARIRQVVDYCIKDDLYVIINIHHDTGNSGWLTADAATLTQSSAALKSMWEQIAVYFKDYGNHLLFEGFNEILNQKHQWNYAGKENYEAENTLNQIFVDTVRKTGGNNASRYLVVNTYAANTEGDVLDYFAVPSDRAGKVIVSVHYYKGTNVLDSTLQKLNSLYVSKGIPVIFGEMGQKNSGNEAARLQYISTVISKTHQYGITCFWWDDGGIFSSPSKVYNYAILNRKTLQWYFPDIVKVLMEQSR